MHLKRFNSGAEEKLVLLHGFTGSTSTWDNVIKYLPSTIEVLTIDLIGHGETFSPDDFARYYVEEQIEDLHELFIQQDWTDFTLAGYSMGGRLALAYAEKYPVKRLILESSSPGLAEVEERAKRKIADELLANKITEEGIVSFIDYWEEIPLFESQKSLSFEKREMIRAERLAQSEIGLANSLRGFSTGVQFSYWDKLEQMNSSSVLIVGELDEKFCRIADLMKKQLPNARLVKVKGVGHAIHVENPEIFATIIEEAILEEDY